MEDFSKLVIVCVVSSSAESNWQGCCRLSAFLIIYFQEERPGKETIEATVEFRHFWTGSFLYDTCLRLTAQYGVSGVPLYKLTQINMCTNFIV